MQELGVGHARVSWGDDGRYSAWGRDGAPLGEHESLREAQRAVSVSLMAAGAIGRAHGGVLLLDDAAEFSSSALDSLRQPMQSRHVIVSRAGVTAEFAADAQAAFIVRKCPCGEADPVCRCSPAATRRYLARLTGPIMDRVPARLHIGALQERADGHLTEDAARQRVAVARAAESSSAVLRAAMGTDAPQVRDLPVEQLRAVTRSASPDGAKVISDELLRGSITLRRADKVMRRAWSLSFLDGASEGPSVGHITAALAHTR